MNDRLKFRAGFKVCYYDEDGNDKELLIKVNDFFSIENGGVTIVVHTDTIDEQIEDLSIDEQASVWEYIRANFDENNEYWLIDDLEYLDQCTGLKDKNGALTYEEDIVQVEGYNYPIRWDNDNAYFEVDDYGQIAYLNYNDLEVIGNIHENKELLK